MKATWPNIKKDGFIVCKATHPDLPNYDGRNRSRTVHLMNQDDSAYNYPATFCGMLVVQYQTFYGRTEYEGDVCTQCSKVLARPANKKEPTR